MPLSTSIIPSKPEGASRSKHIRNSSVRKLAAALSALALTAIWPTGPRADDLVTRSLVPSELDPTIKDFDAPNIVILDPSAPATRPLVVFMSGTHGRPQNAMKLLRVIAEQGYRVIGLEYDDVPAVQQVCPQRPEPDCSADFRAMRVYGEVAHPDSAPVSNPRSESIVARLATLLAALGKRYPKEEWGGYLTQGAPDWSRIVVTGLSQGAGMAAFIAKREKVARVVLFSSPWDFTGADRTPAPWLSAPSATPPDRWYAEYHRRERTAPAIERAYAALNIPADHIYVFDRDLPETGQPPRGPNPYHGSTIHDAGYAPQWREMFGHAD